MDKAQEDHIISIQQRLEGLSIEGARPLLGTSVESKAPPTLSTLPPELLLEIFHFLWEEEQLSVPLLSGSYLLQRHMDMTVMPHSVSSVCTDWDAICALEPKFWNSGEVVIGLAQEADSSTHSPSPSSRLDRHLSRITTTDDSVGIDVYIKSCPGHDNLKEEDQSATFSKSYEAFKKRWPGKKAVQEQGERKAVEDVVRILKKYTGKVRLRELKFGTFISTSLPTIRDLGGESLDTLLQASSTTDPVLVSEPDGLLGSTLQRLHIEAYWTPLEYAPYQSLTQSTCGPPFYANPCAQPIPVRPILPGLTRLSLSGYTFVSFARQYISTPDQQAVRVVIGKPSELGLKVSTLRPEDGGSENPFTLTEFLEIVRLFCGRLAFLALDDVRLPLPEGVKAQEFDWIRCTGDALEAENSTSPPIQTDGDPNPEETANAVAKHQSHLVALSYVQLTHVNGPLVYGIEQVFKGHWGYAEDSPDWPRQFDLTTWWRVKEEDFDRLDNVSSEEREKITEEAKRDYTIYDKEIITSVTWKRTWKVL